MRSRRGARCRTDLHRAEGRPGIPHAVGQARVLFGDAGQAGPAADAGLAARSGRSARAVAVAAAPADRAGIFPEPHCVFRRRLPARARGRAVLRAASRRRRRAQPARRRARAPVQRSRRRRPDAARARRGAARRRAGAGTAARRRGGGGHGEHAVLRCATPTWARAPPIRAPGWTCVPGSAQSAARGTPRSGRCRTNWSSTRAAITSRRSR